MFVARPINVNSNFSSLDWPYVGAKLSFPRLHTRIQLLPLLLAMHLVLELRIASVNIIERNDANFFLFADYIPRMQTEYAQKVQENNMQI